MNNLFDKVAEIQKKRIELETIEKELKEEIQKTFIDLPFQTQLVEANYNHSFISESERERNKIKIYFPILVTPEGYTKSDEEMYRKFANTSYGKYNLVNEKEDKITVKFETCFNLTGDLINKDKVFVQLNKATIVTEIHYTIIINGVNYGKYTRKFAIEELIPDLLKEEMKLENQEFKNGYGVAKAEKEYKEKLEDYGAIEVAPLADQKEGEYNQIEDTRFWTKLYEIVKMKATQYLWYKSENLRARLDVGFDKRVVRVHILSSSNLANYKNGSKIAELQFCYSEPTIEVRDTISYQDIQDFTKKHSEEVQS